MRAFFFALLCLSSVALASCGGRASLPITPGNSHAKNAQWLPEGGTVTPLASPNIRCAPSVCGGGGGGGGNPDYTPTGCEQSEQNCLIVSVTIGNDVSYTNGGNGDGTQPWTQYPSSCVEVGTSTEFTSPVDGKPCSVWQIYQFFNEFCPPDQSSCVSAPAAPSGTIDRISVSIGDPVSSSGFYAPGLGHMFVTLWQGKNIIATLEAGPTDSLALDSKLNEQKYLKDEANPKAYGQLFIGAPLGLTMNDLGQAFLNEYHAYQNNCTNTISYDSYNSNSWLGGLLLAAGYQESDVDAAALYLQGQSGLLAAGYPNGAPIEYCFK